MRQDQPVVNEEGGGSERPGRRLSVLMVLDNSFPPDVRVENEARSLIDAGHDVALLAIGPDDRSASEVYNGIRVYRAYIARSIWKKLRALVGTLPAYTAYVDRLIRKHYRLHPFDVLHVHDLPLFGAGIRSAEALGVTIVGDLHENYVEALRHYAWSSRLPGRLFVSIGRWKRLERSWVNAVDELIVVIDEAAERNVALGVDPAHIAIVPNTIRRSDFDEAREDADLIGSLHSQFTVTYTGAFDVHRGLPSVLKAMARLLEDVPGALLVLVGDGRIRAELEVEAAGLGISANVRFEGWQSHERIKSYIAGSDVCLVPHLKTVHTDATIPHKLFHYMYLGKPVVVSNCKPLERIVTREQAGLVYPAGNARALEEALRYVAMNRGEAERMGRNGRRAVVERYNWESTSSGLIAAYERIAEGVRTA